MQATKLNPLARIPAQATMGAAGYDLTCVQAGVIYPGQRRMVATGISLAVPDGMVGIIKPRSGLAVNHGIDVLAGVVAVADQVLQLRAAWGQLVVAGCAAIASGGHRPVLPKPPTARIVSSSDSTSSHTP